MAKRLNRSQLEKRSIVSWIITLEQKKRLLDARYDSLRHDIEKIILSFMQEHNIEAGGDPLEFRKRITREQKKRLQDEIDVLLAMELTDRAREEALRMEIPQYARNSDELVIRVTKKIIESMDFTERLLQRLFEDTITVEFEKQTTMIGLDRQYVVGKLDDILEVIEKDGWSENLWGIHQENLKQEVTRLIRESMLRGYSPKAIARDLRKTIETTRYNAERLMRTEQAKVQAQSQIDSYKAQRVREFDLIPEPSACDQCKRIASNGPYLVEDARVGENMQPIHPNCRCSTVGRVVER